MKTLHHKGFDYYIIDEDTGELFAYSKIEWTNHKTKKDAYAALFSELFKQLKNEREN